MPDFRRLRPTGLPGWLRSLRTVLALVLVTAAGCAPHRSTVDLPPGSDGSPETPWQEVVARVKAFTYEVGFVPTANFTHFSEDLPGFPFCGRTSRLALPWSYEDPTIEWLDVADERACLAGATGLDVYHGKSEAVGEVASPVTPAMIASGVPRMVYLVVHEDCHDQFSLPYGIEEPLCEAISYRAMALIARQPGPWSAAERQAILAYAERNAALIPLNRRYYEQAAGLYERHARGSLPVEALMRERASLFARAEASTDSTPGSLNNVVLANRMTYARHHPFVEQVLERLGSDLSRLVAFFQQVDAQVGGAQAPADVGPPVAVGRDADVKTGPRQRPAALPPATGTPRSGAAPKPTRPVPPGGAKPAEPPVVGRAGGRDLPATRPSAVPPIDGTETVHEDPAVLLARIRAAEAAVIEAATRLLGRR